MYRAVGNRCAVDFEELELGISKQQALSILEKVGFKLIEVDLVALARQCVGKAEYRRAARLAEAPRVFDCSSLVKWLYGQKGIWLPRRSIQQREMGQVVELFNLAPGDIIFCRSGYMNYFWNDQKDEVGHVGMATGEGTIIHAASREVGIIESLVEKFLDGEKFRGARRIIPGDREIWTFITPPEREVELSDDIRWIIFQNMRP